MIDYRNHEGYMDVTAAKAIARADKPVYRPIVYVCSPYSGDTEGNTRKAIRYSRYVVDHQGIPLTPHLFLPLVLSESTERELALRMDMIFLDRCEAIYVFGDEITDGMQKEISRAKRRGIPITYITEDDLCSR